MNTAKRVGFSRNLGLARHGLKHKIERLRDFMRFQYPRKLDFCRMTLDEMTSLMNGIIEEDRKAPEAYRPVVAIGHTKDLVDFDTIISFLAYLKQNQVPISTFTEIYPKLTRFAAAN